MKIYEGKRTIDGLVVPSTASRWTSTTASSALPGSLDGPRRREPAAACLAILFDYLGDKGSH
jgi:hypothetical protein